MHAQPTGPEIAEPLLALLSEELRRPALRFSEPPIRLKRGARLVYAFVLEGAPPEFSLPLILRAFPKKRDRGSPAHERALHQALLAVGYPVPRILLTSTRQRGIIPPFSVMERLEGIPLPASLSLPARLGRLPALAVEHQAELHALDAEALIAAAELGGLSRPALTLDGRLAHLRRRIERRALGWLEPGYRWLEDHRPDPAERLVVGHGDHLANTLVANGRVTGVIDWTGLCLAGPELHTMHAMQWLLHANELPPLLRPFHGPLARWVRGRYLRLAQQRFAIDPATMTFHEATWRLRMMAGRPKRAARHVAAFRRLTGVEITPPSRP